MPVGGESAAGHDEVDVGMNLQLPSPGVQHAEEPGHLAAGKACIGFEGAQRLRRAVEERGIDLVGMTAGDRTQFLRQGKGDHEVGAGQALQLLPVHPVGVLVVLADRTVAIAT